MEGLLIALGTAFGLWSIFKSKTPAPSTTAPPPPGAAYYIDPGAPGPPPAPAPAPAPSPAPDPAPAPTLSPGVYPAGTQGAIPITISVLGGDSGRINAIPGGYTDTTKTIWYGPRTTVLFKAEVMGFSPFTAFDHFEGPNGAQTSRNPYVATIVSSGYMRAVFAFLGVVGR